MQDSWAGTVTFKISRFFVTAACDSWQRLQNAKLHENVGFRLIGMYCLMSRNSIEFCYLQVSDGWRSRWICPQGERGRDGARLAAGGRSARSGREKRALTDDDDPVEGEPLLDDVSDAGREEAGLCPFVLSPNACCFAACH